MTNEPRGALERCVGDPDAFAADDWGRRARLHHDPGGFADLLTLEDVDHMLTSMSLRLPAFRLVRDGQTLPASSYTKSGRTGSSSITGIADPPRILELFRQGATIVLQGMHRFWRPLAEFCRDLELALGHPTQVNGYITPPGSRGLAVHKDSHDVFVLQAFGRKRWEVWEPTSGLPNPNLPPALDEGLRPGDALYIPQDAPHAARTQESVSGHLTVGVLASTWADVLKEVLKRAEREPALLERLPAGFHRRPAEFSSLAEEHLTDLQRWLEKLEPDEVAFSWTRRLLTTRPPLLEGTLPGLLALDRIEDRTSLRRRPGSVCEVVERDGRLVVFLGDRELRMPPRLGPAMRSVARARGLRAADLAEHLDPESRLVLVRRLVREGLLHVAPPT